MVSETLPRKKNEARIQRPAKRQRRGPKGIRPDFFNYVQKHCHNLEVRRKYKISTPKGYTLYDTSLRETWNAPLVLAALEKQLREMGAPSLTSAFGKKAHADLISCENLRSQRAREIDEL